MNNKSTFSILILQIVGGVIIVALMMFFFSGFATPYLQFLADNENINAFNKFTQILRESCRTGTATSIYFGMGQTSSTREYAWGFVPKETALYLSKDEKEGGMPACEKKETCIKKTSKSTVEKCVSSPCWCLFELSYSKSKNLNFKPLITIPYERKAESSDIILPSNKYDLSNFESIYGSKVSAQTFEVSEKNFILKSVSIKGYFSNYENCINKKPAEIGNLKLEICRVKNNKPDLDDCIDSAEVKFSDVKNNNEYVSFDFSIALNIGVYAIVLSSPDSSLGCSYSWGYNKEDKYPEGESFISSDYYNWESKLTGDFLFSVTISTHPQLDSITSWDYKLAAAFRETPPIKKIRILRCSKIVDDLKCEKNKIPVVPLYKNEVVVWVHPQKSKLFFESFSADRPVIDSGPEKGEFDYYINIYLSPEQKSLSFDPAGKGVAPIYVS